MTWKLSDPWIVRYFFNLASAREFATSSISISFKKNLGFGFWANLVPRKSLQSVILRTLPPVPTYRCAKHFANPQTWSTSPLPCLDTDLVVNILDIVEMLGWFILWRTVGTIICWSKYILSNILFTANNAVYWFQNIAVQLYQKY